MAVLSPIDLKKKFEKGDIPTGFDFVDLIDTLLDITSQWPAVLPAADAIKLTNLNLPDPLPFLSAENLYNLIPDEWINLAQFNPSYADPTSFVLNGDHTERFVLDKRIRLKVGGVYEYTTPSSAVYSELPDVTTVIINDAMSVNTLTEVSASVFSPFNSGGSISPEMVGVFPYVPPPQVKDLGAVIVNTTIELTDAPFQIIEVGADITITFACSAAIARGTIAIKNNGNWTITVLGIDNNIPGFTVGTNVQDIIGIVKSHGKISNVGILLAQSVVV